jgi:hypothetical protein
LILIVMAGELVKWRRKTCEIIGKEGRYRILFQDIYTRK